MDADDAGGGGCQMLAQVINIHAQAAAGEVRLLLPQLAEDEVTVNGLVGVAAEDKPAVIERVAACKESRLKSPAAAIRKFAEIPHLYAQRTQPNIPKLDKDGTPLSNEGIKQYNLLVPEVSSERRRYVPMGYVANDVVTNNLVKLIPNATTYHFGVLVSNVHMAWMRAVCGRLKSDYRYSKDVVYNNFPWPSPSDTLKAKIEQTAQAILAARSLYPQASLADLYDELTMPMELRKAHQENDKAVMRAYGFDLNLVTDDNEAPMVAELFKLYQTLIKQKQEK